MSWESLAQVIPEGDRLLLDSTTLIAYFDGRETISPVAQHIVDDLVRTGRNEAIVSMVTVMELLVRPLRASPAGYRHVLDFLTQWPHLRPLEIDLPTAQEAASLRATYDFKSPDALIIATGLIAQVGHVVTNDERWKKRLSPMSSRVRVCYLTDYVRLP
jgi:predicted nucleic acid-binding protein